MAERTPSKEPPKDVAVVARIGLGGSSWPAAQKAGLVNSGGMWMTPEGLEKTRALKRAQREKK